MTYLEKRILVVAVVYVAAYFLAWYFGAIYAFLILPIDSFGAETGVGLPIATTFLMAIGQYTLKGGNYWLWSTAPLLPMIIYTAAFLPLPALFAVVTSYLLAIFLSKLAFKMIKIS